MKRVDGDPMSSSGRHPSSSPTASSIDVITPTESRVIRTVRSAGCSEPLVAIIDGIGSLRGSLEGDFQAWTNRLDAGATEMPLCA
jgi:hypothetical protein